VGDGGRELEFGISIVPDVAKLDLARDLALRADRLGLEFVGVQ